MAHGWWDFTIEIVAREVKCLETCQVANLGWDWPGYDVVLQKTAAKRTVRYLHRKWKMEL